MTSTILRLSALALVAGWAISSANAQQPPGGTQPPANPPPAKATNPAQPANPADQPQNDPKVHVEARGQVHEAFAQPYEAVANPTAINHKKPPDPIPEEPPNERPTGKNVNWIPGYWQWDPDRNDYTWTSGMWRDLPEGRHWVVGHWTQVADGYYRVRGHWAAQQEPDFQYVDKPPEPRQEQQPAAPDADSLWIPGNYFYADNSYQWRAGYYTAQRPGYVWQPAMYYWSPNGYIYSSGYWDYDPYDRGLLFAPVWFDGQPWLTSGWGYRPFYGLNLALAWSSLFVRPGWGYYYGDWYGSRYSGLGFQPWYGYGGSRYDPLFAYQSWHYRNDPNWLANLRTTNQARSNGTAPLPARTLAAGTAANQSLVAPLSQLRTSSNLKLETVTPQQRTAIMQNVQTMHQHSVDLHQGRFPANLSTNLREHPSTSTSFHPGSFQSGTSRSGGAQPGTARPGGAQPTPAAHPGNAPHNPAPPAGGGGNEGKKGKG